MASRNDPLEVLARGLRSERTPLTQELDDALGALDEEIAQLAEALQVEYVGPGVGMADMGARHVYRLVVRRHVWDVATASWGLKICDALDNNDLRPMWPIQGAGRLRKQQVVAALPELFRGYAEAVAVAGKADTDAGRRVVAMAETLLK